MLDDGVTDGMANSEINKVVIDKVATDGIATDEVITDGVITDRQVTGSVEIDFDVVEEIVAARCAGFKLTQQVVEYLLLNTTTLYDNELKKVEFSDPTAIHSPLYTQYRLDYRTSCIECRRLQNRLCERAARFEKCRKNQTITKKSTEELCTPRMKKTAINKVIAQKKE
jgi:hypothetical protein